MFLLLWKILLLITIILAIDIIWRRTSENSSNPQGSYDNVSAKFFAAIQYFLIPGFRVGQWHLFIFISFHDYSHEYKHTLIKTSSILARALVYHQSNYITGTCVFSAYLTRSCLISFCHLPTSLKYFYPYLLSRNQLAGIHLNPDPIPNHNWQRNLENGQAWFSRFLYPKGCVIK